jgi:methanogenic corrinoid protein MtbC1
MARRLDAELLCASVAMHDRAHDLAEALGAEGLPSDLKVVVGGRGATPTFARRIGATHVNGDLRHGVKVLRRFAR